MRIVFYLASLTISGVASAQSFTNGSIFNFNIGDTLVTQYEVFSQSTPPPPTTVYHMYIDKRTSVNGDTVYYKKKVTYHTPPSAPGEGADIVNATEKFFVTNLATTYTHDVIQAAPCQSVTVKLDSMQECGGMPRREKFSAVATDPCFEAPYNHVVVIEGVGVFNTSIYNKGPGQTGYSNKLVAVSKAGKNCQVIGVIPTSIRENSRGLKLEIYPNPSHGGFFVSCPPQTHITIYDLQGREIKYQQTARGLQEIKFEMAPGVYILKAVHGGQAVNRRVVVY